DRGGNPAPTSCARPLPPCGRARSTGAGLRDGARRRRGPPADSAQEGRTGSAPWGVSRGHGFSPGGVGCPTAPAPARGRPPVRQRRRCSRPYQGSPSQGAGEMKKLVLSLLASAAFGLVPCLTLTGCEAMDNAGGNESDAMKDTEGGKGVT